MRYRNVLSLFYYTTLTLKASLFTFQRRPIPVNSDQFTHDLTDCVYPDLVSCTVPVEQILPSILTMSWSRGMGHLVRAQNIHTIGNLSALKEEQVNRVSFFDTVHINTNGTLSCQRLRFFISFAVPLRDKLFISL